MRGMLLRARSATFACVVALALPITLCAGTDSASAKSTTGCLEEAHPPGLVVTEIFTSLKCGETLYDAVHLAPVKNNMQICNVVVPSGYVVTAIGNGGPCGVPIGPPSGNTYVIAEPKPGMLMCNQATDVPEGYIVTGLFNSYTCSAYEFDGNVSVIEYPENNEKLCLWYGHLPAGWNILTQFNDGECGEPFAEGNTATIEGSAPVIGSESAINFQPHVANSFSVLASGPPVPKITESGALPAGVTFSPETDTLAGKPSEEGTYPITFTASNGVSPSAVQQFTLTVSSAIYDNLNTVPEPIHENGQEYQDTETRSIPPFEFPAGGMIEFAGSRSRTLKSITMQLDSYTCESGKYNTFCSTSHPTKTYSYGLTIKVYKVGAGEEPGELIASDTGTVKLLYRPATNPTCADPIVEGVNEGRGYGPACEVGGYLNTVTLKHFTPNDAVLPPKVIILVSNSKADESEGKIANVGLQTGSKDEVPYFEVPAHGGEPEVGSDPLAAAVYIRAQKTETNFEKGSGPANWEGWQPVFEVDAAT
jgi:hypothetical protein